MAAGRLSPDLGSNCWQADEFRSIGFAVLSKCSCICVVPVSNVPQQLSKMVLTLFHVVTGHGQYLRHPLLLGAVGMFFMWQMRKKNSTERERGAGEGPSEADMAELLKVGHSSPAVGSYSAVDTWLEAELGRSHITTPGRGSRVGRPSQHLPRPCIVNSTWPCVDLFGSHMALPLAGESPSPRAYRRSVAPCSSPRVLACSCRRRDTCVLH